MLDLKIIFEDEVLLVCNKPAGLMVEPDRNNFPNLLQQAKNYLKKTTKEKLPYVQHLNRLDRPVGGIVLFTKQKEHLRNLSEQFAQRTVKKYYLALTKNYPATKTGSLEHWHRKENLPNSKAKIAALVPEGTPYAEKIKLDYTTEKFNEFCLWRIQLHTGKYHQIRAQLASVACPILGDALYGSTEIYKPNAIALLAEKLVIQHPASGEKMIFEVGGFL